MVQFVKGDAEERKFHLAASQTFGVINIDLNDLEAGAYSCHVLGDIIHDSGRSPLANAISKAVFRESFAAIFEVFLESGSLEGYLTVFRAIFGQDVNVTFTTPEPAVLNINIKTSDIRLYNFISRKLSGLQYSYANMVTRDNFNIVFRSIRGMSQSETRQMLFELVPNGIYTTVTIELEE